MAIFQKSVIKKRLNSLDKEQVEKAYQKFRDNYNSAKIEKIKQLKEEEYQDGFLRDLFVDVFGYILKPDNDFNLVREFKNIDDGRKADGAILKDNNAIVVIELKSTKTKDLKSITEQAFNYKNNQPECKYVITSNFQKLRFYIDYANEFEEFDLFHLQKEDFELLYLILNTNSIFSDLPLKLKKETKFHEQEISDKLYKDYSDFKNKLFDNLIKLNFENDKLTLFKKSQKLLDRFLFILFAEDSGLLPPNSISRIIKRYEILKKEDAYKPLYDIFKQYFGYMNIGRKGQTNADNIPAYNGGLFYPDELLDNLKIDDEILIKDLLNLSEYDFNTEVDVNILGHIFEHSLSEIEEITAEIEGTATDRTKSKRKKDGVFYTPKYITQYIVENTIGTLCNEKRKELEIKEIEFDGSYRTNDGKLLAKGKKLYQKLNDYKDWLLSLKIVDPACGSGAFLNQALNFLIHEHKNIDDIIAELTNTALRLFDIDIAILENNLYGVDINEESIEIAKLSLWLRTAQKGRKLSVLSNNIKCGNSLIDDPEVAGDKAFDWEKEFPQVFKAKQTKIIKEEIEEKLDYLNLIEKNAKLAQEKAEQSVKLSQEAINYSKKVSEYAQKQKSLVGELEVLYGTNKGGFDVVIGNPPYVRADTENEEFIRQRKWLDNSKDYETLYEKWDLMIPFYERTIKLLKSNGIHGFVVSNSVTTSKYALKLQEWILKNKNLLSINYFENIEVFKKVGVVPIITIIKNQQPDLNYKKIIHKNSFDNETIIQQIFKTQSEITPIKIFKKYYRDNIVNIKSILLKDICYMSVGMVINANEKTAKGEFSKNDLISFKKTEINTNPFVEGKDLKRYQFEQIKFLEWNTDRVPNKLRRPTFPELYKGDKILRGRVTEGTFDNTGIVCNDGVIVFKLFKDLKEIDKRSIDISIKKNNKKSRNELEVISQKFDLKYLLSIINSKYANSFLNNIRRHRLKNYFYPDDFRKLPIPDISKENQQPFIKKANKILELNQQLQEKKNKFLNRVKDNFEIEKICKKLETFYNYDFKTFIAELKKQKIKISLTQQVEWDGFFNGYKTEINQLQVEIYTTDKEIDQMVYGLYELTEEEIKIVEESVN